MANLGRRPRIREIKTPTALKARFTAETKLDSPTLIEPRFQCLLLLIISLGRMPQARADRAPLALSRQNACGPLTIPLGNR